MATSTAKTLLLGVFTMVYPNSAALSDTAKDRVAKIQASSFLPAARNITYVPANVLDKNPKTAWIEGKKGFGIGEEISLSYDSHVKVFGFRYIPGYAKSYQSLKHNEVPFLEFQINSDPWSHLNGRWLESTYELKKNGPYKGEPVEFPTARIENFSYRYIVFSEARSVQRFAMRIREGSYSILNAPDLGISELELFTKENAGHGPFSFLKSYVQNHILFEKTFHDAPIHIENFDEKFCNSLYKFDKQSLRTIKPKSLIEAVTRHMQQWKLQSGVTVFNPVYLISNPKYERFVFDTPVSSGCYSDGEGGIEFLVGIDWGKNVRQFVIIPRKRVLP